MADSKMKFGLHGIAKSKSLRVGSALILSLSLGCAASLQATEAGGTPNPSNYASFQSVFRDQMHASAELPQETREEPKANSWNNFIISVEVAVCLALSLRLMAPRIGKLLDRRMNPVSVAPTGAKAAVVEEKAVAADSAVERRSEPKTPVESGEIRKAKLDEFYRVVPDQLTALRELFAKISQSPDPATRQKILGELYTEVTSLKKRVGSLDLTPAWQLASELATLLGNFAEKPGNATPSTLRTAAGALILLEDLCVKSVRSDLASNPAARFLAVDDDPISRRAISMALKKADRAPDVAEHGESALKLAAGQTYDAIFLDVEMPGLDGFEVCTKIHELASNRETPVVFVTSHSDFDSRVKSTSSGGRDLIAKPFLSSEISLKALTLLMRGRLDREKASPGQSRKDSSPAVANLRPKTGTATAKPLSASVSKDQAANLHPAESVSASKGKQPVPSGGDKTLDSSGAKEFAAAFAAHGVKHLREMQEQISALRRTHRPAEKQELFNELYMGLNVLRSDAARAGLKSICELASAVGKLVTKLLDKPERSTPSTYDALDAAVTLLGELSAAGAEHDLADSPIRALVVDDDPVARRALSSALQLTVGKPDNAEDGAAAIRFVESKVFDVIFLDILMPEMDGFETCSKIRQTKLNAKTPIIFVSSRKDTEAQEKSTRCGGNGFISKPVLPAEIFLTALTFTLRSRMETDTKAPVGEKIDEGLCAAT